MKLDTHIAILDEHYGQIVISLKDDNEYLLN